MSGSSSTLPWRQGIPWAPAVLAASAVLLGFAPRYQSPVVVPALVPESVTDITPIRQPAPRALHTLGRFTYRCGECHRTEPEPRVTGAMVTKHMEIPLAHGMNTRCLNCHHPTNREVFVDYFGEEIPWDQPEKLCSKCHGPVYRDWQHGSHGRSNGYWDTAQGPLVRLKCTQCHDPHHPSFPPLATAPPPRMLRGEPHHVSEHSGVRNPLRLHNNAQARDHAAATSKGPK